MAKNRAYYLLFFLVCLVFSAAYQSRISAVLLVVAAAYPIIAAVFTAISLFTLRVGFGEKRAVYEKNENFELPLFLHNNFLFPYAPAELDCIVPDNDTGLFLRKQIYVSVAPLKKMRVFVPCMHKYRGSFAAKIARLSVYDPLKIIRFTRKTDSVMQLVFLPRKIPIEQLSEVFTGSNGAVPDRNPTGEKDEFSHVREYATGDIFQLIHWKLTAKYDDLMVKQYDADSERRSVVLCNFAQNGSAVSTAIRQSDMVVETAVAVAMSLSRSGVNAVVDTGTAEGGICEIKDAAGFDRFYDIMSVIPVKLQTMDFMELITSYSAGNPAALFMITPLIDNNILSCAEDAGKRLGGAVVLIYVNCTGKKYAEADGSRSFVLAEVSGEVQRVLPHVAEQILSDYAEINR